MKTPTVVSVAYLLLFVLNFGVAPSSAATDFVQCLLEPHFADITTSEIVYTANNSSYTSVFQSTIQNLRFLSPSTPPPLAIVTPVNEAQIQIVLGCARDHTVQVRIRGDGHDSEGQSYMSPVPFVIIDLRNFRNITVDVESGTAWVQGGATVSEVYYRIAEKTDVYGFTGSTWSTVGISGFLSGGGYGSLKRKYGLGADNVIDVRFMDKNGNIYADKRSLGADVFWAIRGGGASSFGIVLAWKIKLVPVPKIVTVFDVTRTLEQNATNLVYKFQYFAPSTERDLYIRIRMTPVNLTTDGTKKTVLVYFQSLFLGRANRLLKIMEKGFPELGLTKEDCLEMSWVKSTLWFAGNVGFPKGESLEELLDPDLPPKLFFKSKADYITEPISKEGLEGVWKRLLQQDVGATNLLMTPYGGKMDTISESALPFPHRAGNLFMFFQGVYWDGTTPVATQTERLEWLRSLSAYLTPYVSKNPRRSYVNYNDLDLGVGSTTYEEASIWGTRYFKNNFKRLVQVKSGFDAGNFFQHAQSIPPFPTSY